MDHVSFGKGGNDISGNKIQNHISKGCFNLSILGAQIKGTQIYPGTGLEDHTTGNSHSGSNDSGTHIDQQNFRTNTSYLLNVGRRGNTHNQRSEYERNDCHFNQVEITGTDNFKNRVD